MKKRKAPKTRGHDHTCPVCRGANTIEGPPVTVNRGRGPETMTRRVWCPGPALQTSAPAAATPAPFPPPPSPPPAQGDLFDHQKAAAGDREDA